MMNEVQIHEYAINLLTAHGRAAEAEAAAASFHCSPCFST